MTLFLNKKSLTKFLKLAELNDKFYEKQCAKIWMKCIAYSIGYNHEIMETTQLELISTHSHRKNTPSHLELIFLS